MSNIKIITNHWGEINPGKIDDCFRFGGYQSLEKFCFDWGPERTLEEVKISRLCWRGGAGFLTGEKWERVQKSNSSEKYFICNLDESEPGTYKDKEIIDNNPHLLIEGLIISALTVGAKKAFIYLNGNYEKQKDILKKALEEAYENRFLGERILGMEYYLDVEIFSGAGSYVCGEETALINSMEGKRGEPKMRPPYPTEKGYLGRPTVVNNAETLCSIPWIVNFGGKFFSRVGSKKSPGTKLFVLGGAVKNPGVIEAPTGITLRDLIFDWGGGMRKGKDFWFAQLGGASGRLIRRIDLDVVLDYDCSSQYPIGSGAVLVVDKNADIHDLLLSWTDFFRRESCGKCVPCREGTFRLWEIAKRLQDGEISLRDEIAIKDILWTLEKTSFCPLGKFAGVAFGDALKYFSKEIFKKTPRKKHKFE